MNALVFAIHDNEEIKPATLNAVTAAKEMGEVTVLIAGDKQLQPAQRHGGLAVIGDQQHRTFTPSKCG